MLEADDHLSDNGKGISYCTGEGMINHQENQMDRQDKVIIDVQVVDDWPLRLDSIQDATEENLSFSQRIDDAHDLVSLLDI